MHSTDQYLDYLTDFLKSFSPMGRERILCNLKTIKGQSLCKDYKNDKVFESISKVANPRCKVILYTLSKFDVLNNWPYCDENIDWEKTFGANQETSQIQSAAKLILMKIKGSGIKNDNDMPIFLLNEFKKSNNYSIFRKLGAVKFKSVIPGNALIGKQNNHNVLNKGYVLEHIIPQNYIFEEFLKIIKGEEKIEKFDLICSKLFSVYLNSDDDLKLKNAGLNSKMPDNWTWEDDPFLRYQEAGIDLSTIQNIF